MPFVQIQLSKEIVASDPEGKKSTIARQVVKAITDATGLADDDVWIVFKEVAGRDWYVGSMSVETRRKAKKP